VTSSLRASLLGLWLLIVVICVTLAFLLLSIFRLGVSAQIGHVQTQVENSAVLTAQRFKAYEASFPQAPSSFATEDHRRELTLILQLVLADFKEVEGGFWSARDGFLAYAYPSYGGGGVPKKDVPEAEAARIAAVAQAALNSGRAQTRPRFRARRKR